MDSIKTWVHEHPKFTVETTKFIGHQVDEDGWEHTAYELRVSWKKRSMKTDWRTGLGITDSPEDVPWNILDALVSDYWTWKNADGYEDFCSEFGLEGSRKDYRTWQHLERHAKEVERVFGEQLLHTLAFEYERL